MSLGYTGICKKVAEDDHIVIYSYAGENWNDGGKSKHGDLQLQDGMFTIMRIHCQFFWDTEGLRNPACGWVM